MIWLASRMNNSAASINLQIEEKGTVAHNEDADLQTINNPAAEKALLWKIDLHLLPPLFILLILSFLDRINIGNAKIQGMTVELHMENEDYNIALLIFFVPYLPLSHPRCSFYFEDKLTRTQIYNSGSSLQHNHEKFRPFNLALHRHVLLGPHYNLPRPRPLLLSPRGAAFPPWDLRGGPCSRLYLPHQHVLQAI
jgi:hypothetical protein